MIRRILWLICLVLFFAMPCAAVEKEAGSEPSYPGLGEIVPRATLLNEEAATAISELKQLGVAEKFAEQLAELTARYTELAARIKNYGPYSSWYLNRQLEVVRSLKVLDTKAKQLQQEISNQLNAIEGINEQWQERQDFWQGWERHLQKEQVSQPQDSFASVRKQIREVLTASEKVAPPLVDMQQSVSSLQQRINDQVSQIETALAKTQGELFKRNGHPLFAPQYWAQFTSELWAETLYGVRNSFQGQGDFFERNKTLIIVQLLFAAFVALAIYRYRKTFSHETHWELLSRCPVASGLFAAIVTISFFYPEISSLFRFLLVVILLISAVRILRNLLQRSEARIAVYGFVSLVILTQAVRLVGLPLPCYRAYLFLLTLGLLAVLRYFFRRCAVAAGSNQLRFWARLLSGLFLLALGANLFGYVSLGVRVLESSLESIIVVLVAVLAYQIGLGSLGFLFGRRMFQDNAILRQFSRDFQERCRHWLQLILFIYVGLYLATLWGLFSSPGKAWNALTEISMSIGSFELSLQTILLALLVFYLSLEVSWFLQVLLDHQLFERRRYDRGVRDSVKKLLHYLLVLFGFLFAAGLAGFELQNLMVLAGAFGIGIGFGLQDIVNNFFSGIILLFERPIKVGDGVLIDGDYGTVARIGLRSTVVETLDQAELIVPNSQIISQKVTNWTHSSRRVRIVVPVGVAYGSNLELVLGILAEAGEKHADVLDDPKPWPIFVQFGSSSLDFELRVWIANIDIRPRVNSELLLYIDRRFREEGVEIPFPQRDLHVRSIPSGLLPADQANQD